MKKLTIILTALPLVAASFVWVGLAHAVTTCSFTTVGDVMYLDADCTTDSTIVIPDGMMLDGQGFTITGIDAPGGFNGAVVKNDGDEARVRNLNVTVSGLINTCKPGAPTDNRLRGILFDGASGSIVNNTVNGINKGASGCQEGNAIEVRNAPFDGTHPNTMSVDVMFNSLDGFQKSGIVANGDVEVLIAHNQIGQSATQANLAANSIQLGFGAIGTIQHNQVMGNQWLGASSFSATAILLFDVDGAEVRFNNIRGNSDVGIYGFANDSNISNNRVFDEGEDGAHGDYGVFNDGTGNVVKHNVVRGFDTAYEGVTGGKNIRVGGPQQGNAWF
ncbi:MAG: right-handed parallel beta-helix repeat-containing protein [Patescibacteria group bacterium]